MNFNEVPFVDKHYIVNFLGKFIGGFKFCFGFWRKFFLGGGLGWNFWGNLGIFVFDEQKQENLGRILNFFFNLYEFLVFWNEICLQRRSSVDF